MPEEKYQYEVAGDDDSGGDPARVRPGIMVNFFGTLISDQPLPVENDGVLWLCVWGAILYGCKKL